MPDLLFKKQKKCFFLCVTLRTLKCIFVFLCLRPMTLMSWLFVINYMQSAVYSTNNYV